MRYGFDQLPAYLQDLPRCYCSFCHRFQPRDSGQGDVYKRQGLAGRFFKDAAEIVRPRKAAEAGDDVQRVLPVEQEPHGGLDADTGEIPPRRDAQRRRRCV